MFTWRASLLAVIGVAVLAAAPAAAQIRAASTASSDEIPLWSGNVGGIVFVADHPFEMAHEVAAELQSLSQRLEKELGVPPPAAAVRIYIFKERSHYERVLLKTIPEMTRRDTHRNGLFLLRDNVPYLFVLRSDQLMRTLRHEFVHATLNTNLSNLPIWVDEGLATYYEAEPPHGWQPRFHAALADHVKSGGRPDLARLERLKRMQEMGALEYAESWSWIHLCMHGPQELRGVLRAYLSALGQPRSQAQLSEYIGRRLKDPQAAWLHHFDLAGAAAKSRWRPRLFR